MYCSGCMPQSGEQLMLFRKSHVFVKRDEWKAKYNALLNDSLKHSQEISTGMLRLAMEGFIRPASKETVLGTETFDSEGNPILL